MREGIEVQDQQAETEGFVDAAWAALAPGVARPEVALDGLGVFPAPFGVSQLGTAAFAVAGAALTELLANATGGGSRSGAAPATGSASASGAVPAARVDVRLASAWLLSWGMPVGGWKRGTPWHGVSSDYATADGRWIRLQANYHHLRKAILTALDVPEDRDAIAAVIAKENADTVEAAIVDGGGAAAATRTLAEWDAHPQGIAVASEPLVDIEPLGESESGAGWMPTPGRPLAGIRVLDCTRVLAGPMATRFLGGYGAEVLRIDPPGYVEPDGRSGGDLTLGKRCAHLDLKTEPGRERFLALLAGADVFVHGYRADALERLGLGEAVRQAAAPGLIEVTLDAYGWTGPWRNRRGFDTLVQTSAGISMEMARFAGSQTPVLLPAQVFDMATGYLMAAAVIRALTVRLQQGIATRTRFALARTARLLVDAGAAATAPAIELPVTEPAEERVYVFPRGPHRRLCFPLHVEGSPLFWERPGDPYGSATPTWASFRTPSPLAP
jgi:CoA-transferase family III